jgi:hypothetical protein
MSTSLGTIANPPTYFQLQTGKLDAQVKAFIDAHDQDGDNALSSEEASQAGSLTGTVAFKPTNNSLNKALWAAMAGPSNTLNAKEYAQYLITLDVNKDGKITQNEANAISTKWANTLTKAPKNGVKSLYQELVQTGKAFGIETIFNNATEERQAFGSTDTKSSPKPVNKTSAPSITLPLVSSLDSPTPETEPLDDVSTLLEKTTLFDQILAPFNFTGNPLKLEQFKKVHAQQNKVYINPDYLAAVSASTANQSTVQSLFGQYMAPSMYSTLVNQVTEKTSTPTSHGLPILGSNTYTN